MTAAPVPPIDRLRRIMTRLRDPEVGCPWDVAQSFATIAPYTIEEAYEVADAIRREDLRDLKEELGDLLLQVVFHAEMARERQAFDFDDVAAAIADKLIARHPHVFGGATTEDAEGVKTAWEGLKAAERAAKGGRSALDGVALALPALLRAQKLQGRAARVGFDWPDIDQVFDKLTEEIAELRTEIADGDAATRMDELGDVMFVLVNLARHLKVDAEQALIGANAKFERRFRRIEAWLADEGRAPETESLAALEALWVKAKLEERQG